MVGVSVAKHLNCFAHLCHICRLLNCLDGIQVTSWCQNFSVGITHWKNQNKSFPYNTHKCLLFNRKTPPCGELAAPLAARHATADRQAHAQAVLPQPSGSRFQTHWFLHLLLLWRHHKTILEPFSYPVRRFLHAREWRRLHRLHRPGTRPVRGWTSDLFSFQPRPELGGSPVESWLRPWWPSNQLGVLHHLCTVPVYKLLFIRE